MLLTRLLIPSDFGIIGIVMSVFVTVSMVTDLGFESFLIRHQDTEDQHLRNVIWTIHAKRGAALFFAVSAASPILAWLFGKPAVALPLAVASVTFLVSGLGSLSLMTALRLDKARELSLFEFALQVVQTITGILLAVWWRNVWSMIAAMVLQSTLRSVLSYKLFPDSAQRPERDPAIAREFFAFSRVILMSSALTLLIGQSDKFLLGRLFSLSEFGLYAIAVTIASAPVGFCDSYVRRILFPIYAQTWRENPAELARVYYRARRLPSYIYAFGCGGLIGGAALLIAILYDPRYAFAASFLSLLMIASALRLPNVAACEFLTAVGDMQRMLRITVVRVIWLAIAMPASILVFGPIGIVAAVGMIEVPAMLYCWALLHRIKVLDLREELTFVGIVLVGAATGWVTATEVPHLFPHL